MFLISAQNNIHLSSHTSQYFLVGILGNLQNYYKNSTAVERKYYDLVDMHYS